MFRLDLEEAGEPEIKLPTSIGSSKKQESSRETSISALLTTPKPLTLWITTNYGKVFRRWEYQTTWPASWEICMQVKKQQLELQIEQQIGSKSGKEYVKAVYCHPAYFTSMQSTSWEMLGWVNHKLDPDFPEKYQQPQACRWNHSNGIKWKGTQEPLDEDKGWEWKNWLKT